MGGSVEVGVVVGVGFMWIGFVGVGCFCLGFLSRLRGCGVGFVVVVVEGLGCWRFGFCWFSFRVLWLFKSFLVVLF